MNTALHHLLCKPVHVVSRSHLGGSYPKPSPRSPKGDSGDPTASNPVVQARPENLHLGQVPGEANLLVQAPREKKRTHGRAVPEWQPISSLRSQAGTQARRNNLPRSHIS
ncbi:transmembrane protein 242 isoform X4 [Panthera tigris]|uniref:transmembrane protein 242 isoform X4 n=1 Tax=Panthera tigris TaxID=9694 RepID=UPI001C6F8689|nr:transmembrane protein 242 isoform X4 [Panthera tigris]